MLNNREQFQLELINRARLDPVMEAQRLGVGLNQGLPGGAVSAAPKQPLAPNASLAAAAEAHALWMLDSNIFDHVGAGGSSPLERAMAQGYGLPPAVQVTENIAWTGNSLHPIDMDAAIVAQHDDLFLSPGHRINLLDPVFREVGIAQRRGSFTNPEDGITYDTSMVANSFGETGESAFITGVAFNDADGDGFYSMGEGVAGVSFAAQGEVAVTGATGGYGLMLTPAASVTVTVTYGDAVMQAAVDLSDANVKLDLMDGGRLLSSGDLTLLDGVTEAALLGVGAVSLTGNDAGNLLIGNRGANVITGGAGDDTLQGGGGNDQLDGGGGWNVAVYAGPQSRYLVSEVDGVITVADTLTGLQGEGTDTLHNIQVLRFADGDRVMAPLAVVPETTVAAVEAGPEVTGDVLAGATGPGLQVVAVNGVATDIGVPVSGALGTLVLGADGSFAYTADDAQRLPGGVEEVEVFALTVADAGGRETETTLRISVTGVNDPASIAGDTAGAVVEDDPDRQTATGTLTVTDPDDGEDRFQAPDAAALQGDWGSFAFDPLTGDWSYALDNDSPAVQALREGETVSDSLTVTSLDGTASETVTVTVTGVNDPASIAGDTAGTVVEGDAAAAVAAGRLTVTDPDAGEDRFQAPDPAALQTDWGSFAFDPDSGDWSFAIDDDAPAVRALDAGETGTAMLTVTSLDGTASETVAVTVTGSGLRSEVTLAGHIAGRAGTDMDGTAVTFTPDDGGPAVQGTTGADGRFALSLPHGAEGHLDAQHGWTAAEGPRLTTGSALETLRMAVGLNPSWGPAAPMDFIAADFNGDGRVSTGDALGILRIAVGLSADANPRWVFLDAEADLSHIHRGDVSHSTGLTLDGLTADHDVALTAVLVGHVAEYVTG